MSRDEAMGVLAKVVAEAGRWVVYLGVDFWLAHPPGPKPAHAQGTDYADDHGPAHTHNDAHVHADDHGPAHTQDYDPDQTGGCPGDQTGDHPVETVWHRIADFPSEAAARIAARWYERVADRCPPARWPQEYRRDTD